MISRPADQRLLELPLTQVFAMTDPLVQGIREGLRAVDDEAIAAGRPGWFICPVHDQPWALSADTPCPGMEVDLAIRPDPRQGWTDVWQATIDLAIDCECPLDHNMHYLRRLEAQATIAGLPTAIRDLIANARSWTSHGKNAAWWRKTAGLP